VVILRSFLVTEKASSLPMRRAGYSKSTPECAFLSREAERPGSFTLRMLPLLPGAYCPPGLAGTR
jgi:hypothetical protein